MVPLNDRKACELGKLYRRKYHVAAFALEKHNARPSSGTRTEGSISGSTKLEVSNKALEAYAGTC